MSSILETFFILFETNSKDVVKGQEETQAAAGGTEKALVKAGEAGESMGKKIEESGKVGAFEIKELDRVVRRMGVDFIRQTAEMASGLLGFLAVEKLVDSVFETSEMVDQLGKTAKELDANVSDLDAWDQAVTKSGGSADSFQGSLRTLNASLALIGATGKGRALPFFKELGIDVHDAHGKIRPVMDLLPDLADKLSKLSNVQAAGIGEKLGLDPATILLLHSGRQAVEDMIRHQKELGTVTEENVEVSEKFNEQWEDTKDLLRGGMLLALNDILPVLTDLLKGFEVVTEFLREHGELVKGFFIGLAVVVGTIYGPAMIEAAVATVIATAPIWLMVLAIGAAIAAFAIIYDDLQAFLHGNNSVIGEVSKKWPLFGQTIRNVAAILSAVVKDFVTGGELIGQAIVDPAAAWAKFKAGLDVLGNDAISLANEIIKIWGEVANVISKIKLPTVAGVEAGIKNAPGAAWHALKSLGGYIDQGNAANVAAAQTALTSTNTPLALQLHQGLAAGRAGQGGSTTNNVTVGPTTVNTQATDPKAVATAVNDTLGQHITHAINHFSDGVQN